MTVDQDIADTAALEDTAVDDAADEPSTAKFEDGEGREEPAGAGTDDDESPQRGKRIAARVIKGKLVPIMVAVALIASAAVTAVLYFTQFRVDQQTDAAAAEVAVKAATDGTVALLSYAPDTLDKDFANAKSHLTGDFLSYYTDFTTKVVTPAAQQKKVKTNATVVNGAVAEITPDSAVVLLFINQTTTSEENPDGAFAVSSVKVGLSKIDGNWLISTFDPV
ncbi:twin-arginine translocation pathway signal [Mycobacterium sp. LTG2003]